MELKETVPLMLSEDYKERFIAEYQQLTIRIVKLDAFLQKYKSDALDFTPDCPYNILNEQLVHMKLYRNILEERAEIEDVELMEGSTDQAIVWLKEMLKNCKIAKMYDDPHRREKFWALRLAIKNLEKKRRVQNGKQ
jgi:hypothetical protein